MLAKRKNELTAADLMDQLRSLHVTGTDLKALIELTHQFIEEDLSRAVEKLKASRDGSGLPREALAVQLCKHKCRCEAALGWCRE